MILLVQSVLGRRFPLISYESRFKSTVRDPSKDRTYEHRTMGYAEEPLPDPQQFLKKKQGESRVAAAAASIRKFRVLLSTKSSVVSSSKGYNKM